MNNHPETALDITDTTYPVGSILERPGKTAKVLGVSYDRSKKDKGFKGYHCRITTIRKDGSVAESQGLLRKDDLQVPPDKGGWKLKKAEAPALSKQFDDSPLMDTFGLPTPTPPPPAVIELTPGDILTTASGSSATVEAVDAPFVEVQKRDEDHPIIMTATEALVLPLNVPGVPTAAELTIRLDQANEFITSLERRLEGKTAENARLSTMVGEFQNEHDQIQAALNGVMELRAETAWGQVTELKKAYLKTADQNDKLAARNDSLLHELNEIREAETARVADADLPPCKEFDIFRKATAAELSRREQEGWLIEHMQFNESGELNVVYSRIVPAMPAPQPRKAVAAVGPTMTYATIGLHPSKAERVEARIEAAHAEAYEYALQEADRALAELKPLYAAIGRELPSMIAEAVRSPLVTP